MPSHIDPAALAELLRALFNDPELRQFVAGLPNGERLISAMPGAPIALDTLTMEAARLLERHGCIDGALFAALADARPRRRNDIERICAAMGHTAGQRTPTEQKAHQPRYADTDTERLSTQLEHAYQRKFALAQAGVDAEKVQREILQLKRELREGGRLKAGDQLGHGRYLLLEKIGHGGFAVVWKALNQTTRELVAIKVLHSNLAGDIIRRGRFFRGSRMMATIEHEAVVRVLEPHGEDGGYHYFVMEYIEGGNLYEAVIAGRMPPESAPTLLCTLSQVLADIHECGMIHRDIKPSNILLTPDTEPKLADFDLVGAKDTTGGTRTGAMGTLMYGAPEMLDRPQDADASVDVYGLGMTVLFVVNGGSLPTRVVFGDRAGFIDKLAIAADLAFVLKRATSVAPDKRFRDGNELYDALKRPVAGLVTARRLEPVEVAPRRMRLVKIPSGWFEMGSRDDDSLARYDERPQHRVSMSEFTCMKYPVTRRLWREVMGGESKGAMDEHPVTRINWFEAVDFCNQLSLRDGLTPCYYIADEQVDWMSNEGYRLLTEAEWEYACRAGTKTQWWLGDNENESALKEYAWYSANSRGPQSVGKKPANPWGLHDMHGNVWEWCWDWYAPYGSGKVSDPHGPAEGSARVLRGGSFFDRATLLRSAYRNGSEPWSRSRIYGFRVARGRPRASRH